MSGFVSQQIRLWMFVSFQKFRGGIIVKKAITTTLALLSLAGTAFAATPAMDLASGQAQIGYSYNSLQTNTNAYGDLGTSNGNSYQIAYGLSNKLAVTGDYLSSNSNDYNVYTAGGYQTVSGINFDSTAIGLQYKVSNNIAVSAGSVKSDLNSSLGSLSSTEMYGGIAYQQKMSKHLGSYASYLKSASVQDLKAGMTYKLGRGTSLDVGYRNYQNTGEGNFTAEGISYGINHKF